jgi:hypothetical protein
MQKPERDVLKEKVEREIGCLDWPTLDSREYLLNIHYCKVRLLEENPTRNGFFENGSFCKSLHYLYGTRTRALHGLRQYMWIGNLIYSNQIANHSRADNLMCVLFLSENLSNIIWPEHIMF